MNFKVVKNLTVLLIVTFSSSLLAKPLNEEINSEITLYALMSSNTYLGDIYYDLEKEGWVKVKDNGKPQKKNRNSYTPWFFGKLFSNLQYDIWEHKSRSETVFAYKGTEEKLDWLANLSIGISIPYKSAKKRLKIYMEANPHRKVVVTGHSLGGGLALSMSLWENVDAYVFNSSPRVFDGLGDRTSQAKRMAIFQRGDILEIIRKRYPKFIQVFAEGGIVETNFDFSGENNHRMDYLAAGILNCSIENGLFTNFKEIVNRNHRCSY